MKSYVLLGLLSVLSMSSMAASTDLSLWTAEGDGVWTVANDKASVLQTINGAPTVFYSDFNGQQIALEGEISVETGNDDDYVGFVLGYQPGDLTAESPNFILIDWKKVTQNWFGCDAKAGLAISRVTAPIFQETATPWCHQDGVVELARGRTLGDKGWQENTTYHFKLIFNANNIQVYVNNALEMNISGSFANGRFGFYNYSQEQVRYSAITTQPAPPSSNKPEIRVTNGFINFSVTNGYVPDDDDCVAERDYGRAVFDEVNELLYICAPSGWISK